MFRALFVAGLLGLAPAVCQPALAPGTDGAAPPSYAHDHQPSFGMRTSISPQGTASLGVQSPPADTQLDRRGLNEATDSMGREAGAIVGGHLDLPFG